MEIIRGDVAALFGGYSLSTRPLNAEWRVRFSQSDQSTFRALNQLELVQGHTRLLKWPQVFHSAKGPLDDFYSI